MTTVSRLGSLAVDSVGVRPPSTASSGGRDRRIAVCAPDPTFLELARWNLDRQGYQVLSFLRDPCRGTAPALEGTEAAVVVDLDDGRAPCLTLATSVRQSTRSTHLVLLAFDKPDPSDLDMLEPCSLLQKPFAMRDFIRLLDSICGRS